MAAEITSEEPADAVLDAVVAIITAEQQRPYRTIVYAGDTADGIRAELDDLEPPWTATLRTVRDGGRLVGVAVAEWDEELGRAWLWGPWIDGDDDAWDRWARALVEEVSAQLPAAVTSRELSGTVANARLRRLADELGWPASETNHAYVVRGDAAARWPTGGDDDGLRGVVAEDLALITPLHDLEFPASYFSSQQLIERAADGEQIVVVATTADGRFAGYAAGRIQPDGAGYLDFVAVDPTARGTGAGRRLVTGICRRLLAAATKDEVHLTVQDHRAPARSLYEALGFRHEMAFAAYRSPAPER